MKKQFLNLIVLFFAFSASFAHAANKYKDFSKVLECRAKENNIDRLSCYDKSLPPSRTQNADKFESRDQCPDEKEDEKRLSCYDRFFSPTFKTTASPAATTAKTEYQQPDQAKLLACQTEINGTKRLACYDQLFPQATTTEAESAQGSAPNTGKWQTSVSTSPVDDSKNIILSLESDDYIRSRFGTSVKPTLYLACREKKTEVFIDWDVYLGIRDTSMLYRLDKQKAIEKEWTISTDTKAVFYRGSDISFIKSLTKADKMFARITPYGESPVNATFDLRGLPDAVKQLQNACGWK